MINTARMALGRCWHGPWVLKEEEELADVEGGEALQAGNKAGRAGSTLKFESKCLCLSCTFKSQDF